MNVQDLINQLTQLPADARVFVNDLDYGPAEISEAAHVLKDWRGNNDPDNNIVLIYYTVP